MGRHLSDFQRFLQLKAVEGYPEQGGSKPLEINISQEAENAPCLSDLAAKIGWGERKLKMAQWLDVNAPEEIKEALMKNELAITTAYKEEKAKREKKPDWFDQNTERSYFFGFLFFGGLYLSRAFITCSFALSTFDKSKSM